MHAKVDKGYVHTVKLPRNTSHRPAVFTEDGRMKMSSMRPGRRLDKITVNPSYIVCGVSTRMHEAKRMHNFQPRASDV